MYKCEDIRCGQGTWASHLASVGFVMMKHEQRIFISSFTTGIQMSIKKKWSEMQRTSPSNITKCKQIPLTRSGVSTSCENTGSREKEFGFSGPSSYMLVARVRIKFC